LLPKTDKQPWHPFVVEVNDSKPEFNELGDLGWAVLVVKGDGNCGYSCLLIVVDNNGNKNRCP
jgi:hypothetical protein